MMLHQNPDQNPNRRKLTRSQKWIAVVALVVLALALGNLTRVVQALYYIAHLPDLPMAASWTYLAVAGGVWCVVFLVCVVGLVRVRPWARWATLVAVTLYQVHVWVNHLVLDANERARQLWPCEAAVALGLLVFIWGALNWPGVRREFRSR